MVATSIQGKINCKKYIPQNYIKKKLEKTAKITTIIILMPQQPCYR